MRVRQNHAQLFDILFDQRNSTEAELALRLRKTCSANEGAASRILFAIIRYYSIIPAITLYYPDPFFWGEGKVTTTRPPCKSPTEQKGSKRDADGRYETLRDDPGQ
jgi:hypothetical protein